MSNLSSKEETPKQLAARCRQYGADSIALRAATVLEEQADEIERLRGLLQDIADTSLEVHERVRRHARRRLSGDSSAPETKPPHPQVRYDRLREIANIISSRPVMGHWPAMMAEADANFLRSISDEHPPCTQETSASEETFRQGIDRVRRELRELQQPADPTPEQVRAYVWYFLQSYFRYTLSHEI